MCNKLSRCGSSRIYALLETAGRIIVMDYSITKSSEEMENAIVEEEAVVISPVSQHVIAPVAPTPSRPFSPALAGAQRTLDEVNMKLNMNPVWLCTATARKCMVSLFCSNSFTSYFKSFLFWCSFLFSFYSCSLILYVSLSNKGLCLQAVLTG